MSGPNPRPTPRFEGPRPGASCAGSEGQRRERTQRESVDREAHLGVGPAQRRHRLVSAQGDRVVDWKTEPETYQSISHMSPSCPGCLIFMRGIALTSSSVTSSLLKSPPCTTKKRLTPLCRVGLGGLGDASTRGGSEAVMSVARGTAGGGGRQYGRAGMREGGRVRTGSEDLLGQLKGLRAVLCSRDVCPQVSSRRPLRGNR